MASQESIYSKAMMFLTALTAWFALILQLYLMLSLRPQTGLSVPEVVIKFLSFFTILSNIVVAVSLTVILAKPRSGLGVFFSKNTSKAAVALYILVVGVVYNLVLRNIWNPQGLQKLADNLLHVVVPILYIVYYFLLVPRQSMQWKNVWPWLIYPLLYLAYSLIRGAFTQYYPYPFIDVTVLGYGKAITNAGMLSIGFLLLGLIFVGLSKAGRHGVEK